VTEPKPGTMEYRRWLRVREMMRTQLFYYYEDIAPRDYGEADVWNMAEQALDMLDEITRSYHLIKTRGTYVWILQDAIAALLSQ
jgi:hypothetical protein